MAAIWFSGNYEDLSTDRGYQFRFRCDKCGNGYLSTFRVSKLGIASSAIRAASDLFGGVFGRAANSAYEIQRTVGGTAHDAALKEAADEISKNFRQCSRCGKWVCEAVCWNPKAQLCETCRDQAHAKARTADEAAQRDAASVSAACPACGAKNQTGKFCSECGAAMSAKKRCAKCGAESDGNPKFCPECGQRYP
jgi:membrane protease subunit (stomatin/prohibitin family)